MTKVSIFCTQIEKEGRGTRTICYIFIVVVTTEGIIEGGVGASAQRKLDGVAPVGKDIVLRHTCTPSPES